MTNRIRMLTVAYLLSTLPVMMIAQDICDPSLDHAAQARQAISENHLESAVESFTCAIEITPEDASLYGGRGLALILSGDTVGGVTDYQRYEDLTGGLTPFMAQQIDQFFVTTGEDTTLLTQTATSDTPQGHYELGLALQMAGAYDRAILAYNRAISLDPNTAIYYGARGMTYLLYGSPDLAQRDFEQYRQLSGETHPFMQTVLADDSDAVIVAEPQATTSTPRVTNGDAESYYRRALYFQQAGELDLALFDYGIALSLAPDNPQFYAARGLAYALNGQPEQALADYSRYRDLTGDFQNFMVQQIPALQRALAEQRQATGDGE